MEGRREVCDEEVLEVVVDREKCNAMGRGGGTKIKLEEDGSV